MKSVAIMMAICLLLIIRSFGQELVKTELSGIKFQNTTWENLKKIAEESKKIIFVHATAAWCVPCKKMEREVYTDSLVANFFNKHFISFKIDIETEEGKLFKRLFKVSSIPDLLFISGEEIIFRSTGFINTDNLLVAGGMAVNASYRENRELTEAQKRYIDGERESKFLYDYINLLPPSSPIGRSILNDYFKSLNKDKWETFESIALIKKVLPDPENQYFRYFFINRERVSKWYPGIYNTIKMIYAGYLGKSARIGVDQFKKAINVTKRDLSADQADELISNALVDTWQNP